MVKASPEAKLMRTLDLEFGRDDTSLSAKTETSSGVPATLTSGPGWKETSEKDMTSLKSSSLKRGDSNFFSVVCA